MSILALIIAYEEEVLGLERFGYVRGVDEEAIRGVLIDADFVFSAVAVCREVEVAYAI